MFSSAFETATACGTSEESSLAKRTADYLLIEKTNIAPADAILVFGNRFIAEQLAHGAFQLYYKGYAPRIIICGKGIYKDSEKTEAETIKRWLTSYGVPSGDITTETKSTNTYENVLNARKLPIAADLRQIIGVGHIAAARRFIMTLTKQWPEVLPMFYSVNPYGGTKVEDWQTNPEFRRKVLEEIVKIPGYISRGYICEVDIDDINNRVSSILRSQAISLKP